MFSFFSHKNNVSYWAEINSTGWHLEMDGMRTMLENFAKIPFDDIKGNLLWTFFS